MRVLLHTYNTCFQNPSGGVQVRVKKVKSLLEDKGIDVDFFNPSQSLLTDYDILHIYKLDAETAALISNAHKRKLKVFISPIISLSNGRILDLYMKVINRFPISTTYKQIASIIRNADAFLTETQREKEFLCNHYGAPPVRTAVLPNGVDRVTDEKHNNSIFEIINNRDKYILSVGRINQNKNILNLIRAVGPTGINLVVVGGPDKMNGESYYESCLKEAKKYKNVHMIGWLSNDSDLLKSAYQNADTIVLPSFQETFGLVLLEAGIHGAKVTFSNTLPIADYEAFSKCPTFNPFNVDEMRKVIMETYEAPENTSFRNTLIDEFSWDSIINRQISYYEAILNEKNIS